MANYKVIGLMRSEKLTRYDVKGSAAAAPAPPASSDASGGVTPSR